MATLLLAEHDDLHLNEATARALTAVKGLGLPVDILIAGHGCRAAADAAALLEGVNKVLIADDEHLAHRRAEPVAALLLSLSGSYDAIVAPATSSGKNILPRVAALLDVMQISEVTRVIARDTFERPIYAGSAIETVRSSDGKLVLTIRTASFQPTGAGGGAPVEVVAVPPEDARSSWLGADLTVSDRPELAGARIVVSGGRALGSAAKFDELILPLADKLKAAVGASRAAVDAGYAGNDLQVGQTGKAVAPDIYFAIGISGAVQHLVGMKDSKVIVAINKDGDAPIFQVADFGLVDDLFVAVPALVAALDK